MPRPVMRTLLPFLRCFTTKPMKSSRALVASFLVMPVFSASSAATFDSGTVGGADGLVAVAMMRGPLGFLFVNDFLTPQGSVDAPKVIHESIPRKPPMHEKCRFLGLFRPFEAVIHRLQRARSVSRPG